MLGIEKQLLNFLTRKKFIIVLCLLAGASVVLRYLLMEYLSSDMTEFLLPWVGAIEQGGGIAALREPIGNYSIAYMLLLVLSNALPMDPVVSVKLYSILGDYGMAVVVGLMLLHLKKGRPGAEKWAMLGAVLTALLPLPMLNSALWGQCDSIYSFFLLLSVYLSMKDRWTRAFLMLGMALAFKIQAVFLLPFFLIMYVAKRRFSVLNFLLVPVPVFVLTLPAAVQMNNYMLALDIYRGQTEGDDRLFNDYFNLSIVFNNVEPAIMKRFMVALALLACLLMFAFIWVCGSEIVGDNVLLLASWSVMTCVMLLPNMHERYAFAGEMLAWAWFLAQPSVKRALPGGVFMFTALAAYFSFLGGYWVFDVNNFALLNLATYALMSYFLVREMLRAPRHQDSVPKKRYQRHPRRDSNG